MAEGDPMSIVVLPSRELAMETVDGWEVTVIENDTETDRISLVFRREGEPTRALFIRHVLALATA